MLASPVATPVRTQRRTVRAVSAAAAAVLVLTVLTALGSSATAAPVGHITGTVLTASGKPAGSVHVAAGVFVAGEDDDKADLPFAPGGAFTSPQGTFDIALPPGTYKLRFMDSHYRHPTAFYADGTTPATSFADATPIEVTSGATVTGKGVTLVDGGVVHGTVTSSSGTPTGKALAVAYRYLADWSGESSWTEVATASTETQRDGTVGAYSMELQPGDYRIGFRNAFGSARFAPEFHPDTTSVDDATTITVATGTDHLVSAALADSGGTISGRVVDEHGVGIGGITVGTYWPDFESMDEQRATSYSTWRTETDADGYYTVKAARGPNRVRFGGKQYAYEYWDDQPSYADSDTIDLADGDQLVGRNVELAVAPTTNSSLPRFDIGIGVVGEKLIGHHGTWSPAGLTFTRQWLRNGTPIPGATGLNYRLTAKDAQKRIQLAVTASRPDAGPVTATSQPTPLVKWVSVVTVTGSSPSKGKVLLNVKVRAGGKKATGKVTIRLASKTLKVVTLKNGSAAVTLWGQPKGRRTYKVSYATSSLAVSTTAKKVLTVK